MEEWVEGEGGLRIEQRNDNHGNLSLGTVDERIEKEEHNFSRLKFGSFLFMAACL